MLDGASAEQVRSFVENGGGVGFIPVPVNFLQVAMGNGPGTISDRIAAAGELLPTWRVDPKGRATWGCAWRGRWRKARGRWC